MPKGIYNHFLNRKLSQGFQKGHPSYLTEESRKKIGKAHKGRKHTKEWNEKIGKAKNGKKLSKEHKRKIGLANKGEKNYRWIADRSKLKKKQERNDSAYQGWAKQVKKRDNNQCAFKGQDCSGYNIAHHILSWRDYPELRYEVKNGITLCQYHHPSKRKDETRLILTFQELVGSEELIWTN